MHLPEMPHLRPIPFKITIVYVATRLLTCFLYFSLRKAYFPCMPHLQKARLGTTFFFK